MLLATAVFSPLAYWPILASFLGGVALLLALDLFVIERLTHTAAPTADDHRRRFRISVAWTVICVAAALVTAGLLRWFALHELTAHPELLAGTNYATLSPERASGAFFLEFITAYLVEISLSVDNLFVFLVIFRYFALDHDKQHRVLFWGIVGAVLFRAAFIGVGAALVGYAWVLFAMGVFLVITGVRLVASEEKQLEPEKNPFIKLLAGIMPVAPRFDGTRFFTMMDGKRAATPLLVALVVIETTDIAFAVDSVPAVLSISQEPFIAFGSNICAILGLRAMFFVVAEAMQKFHLLKYGLGLVLVWVGLKMTALPYLLDDTHLPAWVSLCVIAALIGGTMLLSLIVPQREEAKAADQKEPTHG